MECNPFEILFFPNFIFKNGATPKSKFFISLKNIDNEIIVVSLPSSQDFIPDAIKVEGCIEYPDKCISCFCFLKNSKICNNTGFSFLKDTFIYANYVDTYSLIKLSKLYPIKGIDYIVKGTLSKPHQTDLLNCLKNSHTLKRKIKKFL
ncbi:hypothetical protein [Tenacibaculum finnmarkense]|uniref:hypothetical protein n=1 Tax=Tenacibaculum finnmarkense TaxID=2781243 RepID=UPI00187B2F45|nr:hypothetical protein [Tenacibaculum finnmarkense]MBE7645516.1 hypothetical protein [Tenacibaculum finnmarkense genomovar ulcerans]MBE7647656.1 hypothetical protein [Tenacibaculum finnmarkense genomovar ulcerans]MBE7687566.1 hypothetical protein [Tenacibaculum finnmarkense genomovar ulcerans]MCD8400116.1 hypothetical protein [Tenacibaculum finnmarkense genomovar ulcerans]MCD8409551.1 hypothetical protein [Tenacibaculum finnmarkense genomovar ulcerans]